jgi:hypothetical protein
MVTKVAERVRVNLGDEGIVATLDETAFVNALDTRLPADGHWDGRSAKALLDRLVKAALRVTEQATPTGEPLMLVPPATATN